MHVYERMVESSWMRKDSDLHRGRHALKRLNRFHKRQVLSRPADLSAHGWNLLREYSTGIDALVKKVLEPLSSRIISEKSGALIVDGGNGRREQAIFSDLDLTYGYFDQPDDDFHELAASSVRSLGDILGPRCGGFLIEYDLTDPSLLEPQESQALTDHRILVCHPDIAAAVSDEINAGDNPTSRITYLLSNWKKNHDQLTQPEDLNVDIKNMTGGLRTYHFARWFAEYSDKAVPDEIHYAAGFLQLARNFLHTRRTGKELDEYHTEDFEAFKSHYGSDAFTHLQQARRQIKAVATGIYDTLLEKGISVSDNVKYTAQGLQFKECVKFTEATYLELLLISQENDLDISYEQATKRLGHVVPSANYAQIFATEGNVATTIRRIRNTGFLDQFIHGTNRQEGEINSREGSTELGVMLSALDSHYKMIQTEPWADVWKNSSYQQKVGYGLAHVLVNATPDEIALTLNQNKISEEAQAIYKKIVFSSSKLRTIPRNGPNNVDAVNEAINLTTHHQDLIFLHALSRGYDSESTLDEDLRELYGKVVGESGPERLPYEYSQHGAPGLRIKDSLPKQFFTGRFKHDDLEAIKQLLYADEQPSVTRYGMRGELETLRIACEDFPGLLSVISGHLYDSDVELKGFNTFTLSNGLALDYITILSLGSSQLQKGLARAISERDFLTIDTTPILSQLDSYEWSARGNSGTPQYHLKAKSDSPVKGAVYGLTTSLHEFGADIFNITAYPSGKGDRYTLNFEVNKTSDEVEELVLALPHK